MFSPNIQNLINTSGKDAAMARASQLIKYVDNYNKNTQVISQNINNNVTSNPIENTPKFSQVLQKCETDTYKFRETNPRKVVFGSLVRPTTNTENITSPINITNPINSLQTTVEKIKKTELQNKKYSREEISKIISEISEKHGVDEKLVNALINQESGFNPTIESKAGAIGLMQLMPATAKSLGVQNPKDPNQNVDGGVRYLKSMLDKYNGNLILALAAYNAGPGAVDKYKGVPPYKETQNYVKNILANYLG